MGFWGERLMYFNMGMGFMAAISHHQRLLIILVPLLAVVIVLSVVERRRASVGEGRLETR